MNTHQSRDRLARLRQQTCQQTPTLTALTEVLVDLIDVVGDVTEPVYSEMLSQSIQRFHMRIQVTKNTKGYSYETSVTAEDVDGETVVANARQLLIDADTIARDEIGRRELLDGMATR